MKKQWSFFVLVPVALLMVLSACQVDPFGQTEDRPGIPLPSAYNAEVPRFSDVMVVEVVTVDSATSEYLNFNPRVTKIFNTSGTQIFDGSTTIKRIMLMEDGEVKTDDDLAEEDGPGLSKTPQLQFERYWVRLGEPEYYPRGTETTHTVRTTTSVSSSETYSFTESLSIEAEVSASYLFASVSVKTSASFSATQSFKDTTTDTQEYEESFTVSALEGKSCVYTVWQLYERIRYVAAEDAGTAPYTVEDELTFDDIRYDFDEDSTCWIYPTATVIPVTTYFAE